MENVWFLTRSASEAVLRISQWNKKPADFLTILYTIAKRIFFDSKYFKAVVRFLNERKAGWFLNSSQYYGETINFWQTKLQMFLYVLWQKKKTEWLQNTHFTMVKYIISSKSHNSDSILDGRLFYKKRFKKKKPADFWTLKKKLPIKAALVSVK